MFRNNLKLAVTMLAVLWIAAQAYAGRGMGISRAFSYAYNNPRIGPGQGPMGSSMYYGGSMAVPTGDQSSYSASPYYVNPSAGPMVQMSRTNRVYTPMAPMTLSSVGGTPTLVPMDSSSGNLVRDMASALALKESQGYSFNAVPLTSLAPQTNGAIRAAMLRGEQSLKNGDAEKAISSFQTARTLSKDSPESLLSLAHANMVAGGKSIADAAKFLAEALKAFPDLPLVRINTKEMLGGDKAFQKCVDAVAAYARDNPKDASALLLLGYVQWRQGQVDKALDTLDDALALGGAAQTTGAVAAMLDGIARSGQIVLSDAPPLDKPRNYDWAGISASTPMGFKGRPLTSANQVITGVVENKEGTDAHQLTLYAYRLGDSTMTVNTFLDAMVKYMAQSPTVKDMVTDAQAEVPFQTGKACVILMHYSLANSDRKIYMGWVAFINEPKDKAGARMAYILGLAVSEKAQDKLLPTLAAVAKSINVSEPKISPLASMDLQGATISDPHFDFSIVQPASWAGSQTDRGFQMCQADFSGKAAAPKVEVIVMTIDGKYTARSFGEEVIHQKTPAGMTRNVVSQGQASLLGQDGYQFVVSQEPAEVGKGPARTILGRLVCMDQPSGKKLMYALVVDCPPTEVKDIQAVAEKIAATMKLLPVETGN